MNGYRSAWDGAAQGISSGIDNAIKLYSAKNAQEDQAYKQTLRQREEAEYAEKMAPIGTPESLAAQHGWDDRSREKMLGIMEAKGYKRGVPIKRYQANDIINALGVNEKKDLLNMRSEFLDKQIKDKTAVLGKLDKTSPAYSGLQSELNTLGMEYGSLTAESQKLKYMQSEEARKQSEEKRKESAFPLEQEKTKAEIQKIRALAAAAGGSGGLGGLTPAQLYREKKDERRDAINDIEDRIKEYDRQLKEEETKRKDGKPTAAEAILRKAKDSAWGARTFIVQGGDPSKLTYYDVNNLGKTGQQQQAGFVVGPDGRKYKEVPDDKKAQAMVFPVGYTGLGATPAKNKPKTAEERFRQMYPKR